MYRLSIILLLAISLSACKSRSEPESIRRISIKPVDQPIPLDSIFESYEIYRVTDAVFGYLFHLTELDDKLLLNVQHDSYGLLTYDIKTKESRAMAFKGRGPDEFRTVGYPELSENGIFVPDRMNHRVLEFDTSGAVLQSIKIPDLFEGVVMSNYPVVYLYKSLGDDKEGVQDFRISVVDESNKSIISEFIPLDNDVAVERGISRGYSLLSVNDTVVLCQALCDTIYNITRESITPRYIIDTEGKSIPQDELNNPEIGLGDFFGSMLESDKLWLFIDYFETDKFLYITYTENRERCSAFFNKETGFTSLGKGIKDNIVFGKIFNYQDFHPVGQGHNCLYFAVDPIAVLNNEAILADDRSNSLKEILTESDNSLIVKLTFK